jgi:hypothetical protein
MKINQILKHAAAKVYVQRLEGESGFTCFIKPKRYNPSCFVNNAIARTNVEWQY